MFREDLFKQLKINSSETMIEFELENAEATSERVIDTKQDPILYERFKDNI